MPRKREELKIRNVKYTYSGSDEDLLIFFKAVIQHYLISNKLIDKKAAIK